MVYTVVMKFGEYLRALRERAGLDLTELGDKIGVTYAYISNLEHSRAKPPTAERCKQISAALKLSESEENKLLYMAYEERTEDESTQFFVETAPMYGTSRNKALDEALSDPEIVKALTDPVILKLIKIAAKGRKVSPETLVSIVEKLPNFNQTKIEALIRLIS